MSTFFFEIGANLLSEQFRGKYNGGKRYHVADMETVLKRADDAGVKEIVVTAGTLSESKRALALARSLNASGKFSVRLHSTVGVHPTNAKQLDPLPDAPAHNHDSNTSSSSSSTITADGCGCGAAAAEGDGHDSESHNDSDGAPDAGSASSKPVKHKQPKQRLSKEEYIAEMHSVIQDGLTDGTVVAIGECGLDYDRLFFSPKASQLAHFEFHFDLAERYRLPMFLHDRNTGGDFAAIMKKHRHRIPGGVVHSFTGSADDLAAYLDMGLDIGINGCSMKTEDNVAVVRMVPLDKLHLETDAPWCEIKKSHASHKHVKTVWPAAENKKYSADKLVKGRSEPCQMVQVAEAVAGIKGLAVAEVAAAAYANSRRLFLRR